MTPDHDGSTANDAPPPADAADKQPAAIAPQRAESSSPKLEISIAR